LLAVPVDWPHASESRLLGQALSSTKISIIGGLKELQPKGRQRFKKEEEEEEGERGKRRRGRRKRKEIAITILDILGLLLEQ